MSKKKIIGNILIYFVFSVILIPFIGEGHPFEVRVKAAFIVTAIIYALFLILYGGFLLITSEEE